MGEREPSDRDLSFDDYGRLLSKEQVQTGSKQSLVVSDRVNDVFMGMGYMKENCSPNAC